MKHLLLLLLFFLRTCAIVESLNVRRPSEVIRVTHVSAGIVAPIPDANAMKASAQDVDWTSAVLTRRKASKLVWFLGCSIDQYATLQACQNANAVIQTQGVGAHSHYCTFGGLTLVFTF